MTKDYFRLGRFPVVLTVVCLWSLALAARATEYPRIGAEPLLPAPGVVAKAGAPRLEVDPATVSMLELPPLDDEAARLAPADAKRYVVGIGRDFPDALRKRADAAALDWQPLAGGGHGAILAVTSPGARALRLEVELRALPAASVLRFFAPDSGEVLVQLDAWEALAAGTGQLWSPIVQGDSVGLEITLPAGVDPARVDLAAGRVSHFPGGHPAHKALEDIGNAASCNVDVACSAATPRGVVDSVAKYAFTSLDGFTILCTGNLLNDTDPATQQPYFLTARHCINNAVEAASMELYWFFQRERCGGPAPTSVVTQFGGADLLVSDPDSDHSLVLLNRTPPGGAVLGGWDSAPVAANTPVVALHHPSGDLKKLSLGVVEGASPYVAPVDGEGDFLLTRWSLGTTEGGSSGSGIFQPHGAEAPYLVGVLSGGLASCSARTQPDWYGRFDRAFPRMRDFLQPAAVISPVFTGIWWDPTRGGQGVQLIAENNQLGGVWYLYDESGQAQWLTFVGELVDANTVQGNLLRFSGPPLGTPWSEGQVDNTVVGTLSLTLVSATEVRMNYQLGNTSGDLVLTPFRGGATGPATGVWYDPGQSGRGLQLLEQGGLLEGVWYLYDRSGEGLWVTFQAPLSGGVASGDLLRFSGPPLGTPYREELIQFSPVGTVSVEQLDADSLFFSYRIDGVEGQQLLVPFGLP